VEAIFPGAAFITDKRPDNFLHIGLIKTLFPAAKIVHTRRNPLDNILSIYFLHFQHSIDYGLDLGDIAHWYQQYVRLMDHWHSLYGEDILDVEYDVLVREPEATIARVLAFCGLLWEDQCLSFHENRGVVKTASAWQVRKPLYQRSSGRWRNYRAHFGNLVDRFEA
ncbi:MAG: sulfotransferase family protein, partial [Allosphingosinicella sp.]